MKISTKGRYALLVMVDLAEHSEDGYISLKDIAERQELSMKYLEMIVAMLNRAGFVTSQRGKSGGYRLAKKPEEYTVGSILKMTEGSLAPVSCVGYENGSCSKAGTCITFPLWKKLDKLIDDYLEGITLSELMEGQIEDARMEKNDGKPIEF